jgi:hypothetical protein
MGGAGLILAAAAAAPSPATVAALPLEPAGAPGAALPFVEHEAENGRSNGRQIGPDRSFGAIAAEASGRRAVMLEGVGSFVEFTLGRAANALTVRLAIPDAPDGRGLDATLGVHADGVRIGALPATSRYSWFYGAYPFSNRPADGKAHRFFAEARLHLGRTLAAGTRVRLMVGREDRAPWYAVDLADFELVPPPAAPPPGALSILAFGADPSGRRDSRGAIARAIRAARARGATVWIPPGRFRAEGHIFVDRVTVAGAGPWHSLLFGRGVGVYGRRARRVTLRDFAIVGEVGERNDKARLSGVGGAMGGGSLLSNLWIQHHKTGLWFDGPMDGIRIERLRILDNAADGLNFRRGVSNAIVENSFVRNSGDDGLAAWSHREPNRNIAFRNNIVIAPTLANGIAIYGGRDIEVTGNLVADTVTQGGGIHVGNRFDAVPAAGTIRIAGNLLVRAGNLDPNWRFGVGALWFYALDHPLTARILVEGNEILGSTMEAVQFIGKPIEGVAIDRLAISGASHAVQLRSPGSASFSRVTAEGLTAGGVLACDAGFRIVEGPGNSGWAGRKRC